MLDKLLQSVEELINDNIILITGGTGSFGHKITEIILNNYKPYELIEILKKLTQDFNEKTVTPDILAREIEEILKSQDVNKREKYMKLQKTMNSEIK